MNENSARELVGKIINDLTSRSGLDNEWDNIDPEIQEEIINEWTTIVLNHVSE